MVYEGWMMDREMIGVRTQVGRNTRKRHVWLSASMRLFAVAFVRDIAV